MSNVVNLADRLNDGRMASPEQAAADFLARIEAKEIVPTKILCLALNTEDGQYHVSFSQAGMSCSEMIALLEVAKSIFLKEMGY